MTHLGSSHGLTLSSALMSPPALRTASCRRPGALVRLSSRAKKATVVSGAIAAIASSSGSSSLSFQRSTPSTMMNRRPIANVIALSAPRDRLGRRRSPSNSSTPWAPLSASASARRRLRRSAIRPWSSPWIRYAGLNEGTASV